MKEARDVARCHDDCCQKIHQEVIPYVNGWKQENYHRAKSLVHWKEVNEAKRDFHSAQKPWKAQLQQVTKLRKAYQKADKVYNLQKQRVYSAENNPNFNFDRDRNDAWLTKAKEKEDICQIDVTTAKSDYEYHLRELFEQYKDNYKEDMYAEFRKCQEAERKRIVFLKEAIMKYMKAVDLTADARYAYA